jgi:uncharacterized protein (TIGR03435 family)
MRRRALRVRMSTAERLCATLLLAATAGQVFSQSSLPAFEVASVRAVRDDPRTWALRQLTRGRYRSQSNVNQLIMWAWKLRDYQILAAPEWMYKERFEIQATTGRPVNNDEARLMVQALMAERFGLKVHRESREMPVYVLVVGKDGHKLEVAKAGGDAGRKGINIARGSLVAREGSMDDFADVLTTNLDRPVLDKTGLTGRYDFSLTWHEPPAPPNGAWSPIGSALFTPIRELGLRLDPKKEPVDVLVVDSITHPTEN